MYIFCYIITQIYEGLKVYRNFIFIFSVHDNLTFVSVYICLVFYVQVLVDINLIALLCKCKYNLAQLSKVPKNWLSAQV